MKRNRTIPLRQILEPTIFDELKSLYPTVSNRGIEYKQTCSFLGIPVDFDFAELSENIETYNLKWQLDKLKIKLSDVFAVYVYCLMKMANENGYYFLCHNKTPREISFNLEIDMVQITNICDFLEEYKYLYNFDNKITSTIAVRNYECIQSSRATDRSRKTTAQTEEVKQESAEPILFAPPITPDILDMAEEIITDDDLEF